MTAQAIEITSVNVLVPTQNKSSQRISSNFALNHIDKSTGWSDESTISLYWSSDAFAAYQLRIKKDIACWPDSSWEQDTTDNTPFFTGQIKELNGDTKLYFATQNEISGLGKELDGNVAIYAELAPANQ